MGGPGSGPKKGSNNLKLNKADPRYKQQLEYLKKMKADEKRMVKAKAKSEARKKAADELEAINKASRDRIAARNKK